MSKSITPSAELIVIHTVDFLELPGLFYSPAKPGKKAALYIHGNGDNAVFYKPEHINGLAAALIAKGIGLLALNNRGAHLKKQIKLIDPESLADKIRYRGGAHYEKIIDCVKDIDAAADFLLARGYTYLSIIGESTGANKICVYNAHAHKHRYNAYVLVGPGDDSGLYYDMLGKKKFWATIDYAKHAIDHGQPLKLLPAYTGLPGFSAQSAYDMIGPDQPYNTFPYFEATRERLGKKPLFGDYQKIAKPMLVVFGGEDEYVYTAGGMDNALDLLRRHTNPQALKASTFTTIPGADHGFTEHNQAYAQAVASWLAKR